MGDTPRDLRKVVEGILGYRVYDCVWARAVGDYGAEDEPDRLEELTETVEDLQDFAIEVVREYQSKPTVKRRWSKDSTRNSEEGDRALPAVLLKDSFQLNSAGRAALRALSAYTALKANRDPRVIRFRSRVLGTGFVSRKDATNLLHSFAARFLTLEQMRELDVPLVGHRTTLLGPYNDVESEEHFDHAVSLRVEPPGISLALRYTNAVEGLDVAEGIVRCEVENGRAVAPYKVPFPSVEVPGTGPEDPDRELGPGEHLLGPVLVGGFDTAHRPANVWPGSLVDEIHCLAEELSESFMWPSRTTRGRVGNWWDVDSVAMFLLTGTAPIVHPVKVKLPPGLSGSDTPARVVLEVLPWMSPEGVVESLAFAKEVLGIKGRNQGALKFDLVTFVLQREKSYDLDDLNFGRLREDWNTEFPDKKFRFADKVKTYFKRGLEAVQQRYHP